MPAFAPNFTTSQPSGTLTSVLITDTSTSDPGITGRSLRLQKYDGTYLADTSGTSTFSWPVTSNPLTIPNLLDKDYCLLITVTYYIGSTINTTKSILTLFTGYNSVFLRRLTQALAANNITLTNKNFWVNKNRLRVLLDDAGQAVSLLNDQTIAQFCLDAANGLSANISNFF